MKPKYLALALISALGLASLPSTAEARGGHGGGHGRHYGRMLEKLDLTEAQQKKLEELKKGQREQMKASHEKTRELRKQLREALKSDASKDELRKIHNELQGERRKMSDARFDQILAIREILTPEQRKKFEELKGKRGGKGRHRKGKRGGGWNDDDSDE